MNPHSTTTSELRPSHYGDKIFTDLFTSFRLYFTLIKRPPHYQDQYFPGPMVVLLSGFFSGGGRCTLKESRHWRRGVYQMCDCYVIILWHAETNLKRVYVAHAPRMRINEGSDMKCTKNWTVHQLSLYDFQI